MIMALRFQFGCSLARHKLYRWWPDGSGFIRFDRLTFWFVSFFFEDQRNGGNKNDFTIDSATRVTDLWFFRFFWGWEVATNTPKAQRMDVYHLSCVPFPAISPESAAQYINLVLSLDSPSCHPTWRQCDVVMLKVRFFEKKQKQTLQKGSSGYF